MKSNTLGPNHKRIAAQRTGHFSQARCIRCPSDLHSCSNGPGQPDSAPGSTTTGKGTAVHAIADTERLVADGIITADQARTIEVRARQAMVYLAINSILCFGIIAATGGLIVYLATPLSVALTGFLFLAIGLAVLARGSEMYRMFGNAAALIGAGMLIGGASLELMDKYESIAGPVMVIGGLFIGLAAAFVLQSGNRAPRFVTGAILLMGLAMHLAGLVFLVQQHGVSGWPISLFYLYAAAAIAAAGWVTDVRPVTAAAIVPFAQALDTGTFYFHAAYVLSLIHISEPTRPTT